MSVKSILYAEGRWLIRACSRYIVGTLYTATSVYLLIILKASIIPSSYDFVKIYSFSKYSRDFYIDFVIDICYTNVLGTFPLLSQGKLCYGFGSAFFLAGAFFGLSCNSISTSSISSGKSKTALSTL